MHEVFTNLLVACPNNGGLFLLHQGTTYKLDGMDTTGFMIRGRQMLRGLQPARLVRYADGEECGVTSGEDFGDIHDVLLEGQFHYVVKTDDNEVVKLDELGQERQRWTLPGERDSWHVNCMTRWGSRLVFSAFGDLRLHKEYKQKSQGNGFVQDLDTGEKLITGLSQPHSLVAVGGGLLLANSENFEIREYDGRGHLLRSKKFNGYTRGMLLHKNVLYVGLSRSRNVDLGPIANAVVVALDAGTWEEMARQPLPANEIFSIQRMDDAEIPMVLGRLASHASRFLGGQVASLERECASLKEAAETFEGRAEELRLKVAARDALICDKEVQLNSHNEVIRENERKIYGLLETVHGKDLHIQSREEVIRAREMEVLRRDEVIQARERELGIRDQVIQGKDAEVRVRDGLIRQLEEQLVESRLILQKKEQNEAYLGEKLAGVESSLSWRLTAPLRSTKSLFRKIFGGARRARDGLGHVMKSGDARGKYISLARSLGPADAARHAYHFLRRGGPKPSHVIENSGAFDLRNTGGQPVVVLCTRHCHYIGEAIVRALRRVGIVSHIIYGRPERGYDNVPHFVICPQMFQQLPDFYVSFQMEQTVNSRWFTKEYLSRLENSFAVFDYSLDNIRNLTSMGLSAKQFYYLPISYVADYVPSAKDKKYKYDVLFYGDINNDRRRACIAELEKVCKVKVINDTFGPELFDEIGKAKLIVNIHYYAGALLETTRIWECLSLGKLVVSERSSDMEHHAELLPLVDFVDVDDFTGMAARVRHLLADDTERSRKIEENAQALGSIFNRFDYFFYRFLLATDNISFEEFWTSIGSQFPISSDKLCLNLPEYTDRAASFDKDNVYGFVRFPGLRHSKGWVGCALSYKYMLRLALERDLPAITICEDDVDFPKDFESVWVPMYGYLMESSGEWDVFSGLMADLHVDAKVLKVTQHDGREFVTTDKLISTVFNVYQPSCYGVVASWDETNRDVNVNTIDRYLEKSQAIKVMTTSPFLVGHKEELYSTLWGGQNTIYTDLIAKSSVLLREKIDAYQRRSRRRSMGRNSSAQ